MYVYKKIKEQLWKVGHYEPDGPYSKWHPESDHETSEAAAARVHYLNGGEREKGQKVQWSESADVHTGRLIEFLVITDGYNRNSPCALVEKDGGVVNLVWFDERREIKFVD